ncbi:hypothetical protein [Mesorhizobium sp. M0030]|uniref:hypothetical protein n=1 Tax=Mesorhizobium sp. M0030 TaxID=2956851 RepID=UPI003336391E
MGSGFNKDAYQMAWNWFRVHADQRMELFKTYVYVVIGLTAGYISLYNLKSYLAACGVSALALIICLAFKALDVRVSGLLKFAESALIVEEERLKDEVEYDDIRIVAKSSPPSKGFITYRRIFNAIFVGTGLLFIGGFIASYQAM